MRSAVLVLICAASTAAADVQFLSAERVVFASASTVPWPPETDERRTSELGYWHEWATTWLGDAEQESFIGENRVDYRAMVGSGGGAGHRGVGRSTMTVRFRVGETTRWDVLSEFTRIPFGYHLLTRLADGADMFGGRNWHDNPFRAFGYLESGEYELLLSSALYDAGFSAGEHIAVQFSVPTPGPIAALASAAIFALRRRR